MKLLRYGPSGHEKPGLLDADGVVRDLSGIVADLDARRPVAGRASRGCAPSIPRRCRRSPARSASARRARRRQVPRVGLNYSDHAAESGIADPEGADPLHEGDQLPVGPNDDVVLPRDSTKIDWEVELGIVIGTKAHYVERGRRARARRRLLLVNDVSEREFQLERGGQWDKGKGCDTFGPVGPWLVTADEVGDPQALDLWLDVNGERCQTGNTGDHDLRLRASGQLHQPLHDADAGRHHHHRHAARRRHGHEAARVSSSPAT